MFNLFIFLVWNLYSALFLFFCFAYLEENYYYDCAKDFFSYKYYYNYVKMNIVGAWICAIVVNLICPIMTILVWGKELFFVGRK